MKSSIFLVILVCCISFVSGQDYKMHTVAPKENYYSIGRLYNVSPKQIATVNNLNMDAGLQIGQKIKIPSSDAAPVISTPVKAVTSVAAQPTQHTVVKGEGLYRISKMYN